MANILFLAVAFALILLNAFFVAAEFGMVKLRHTRVVTIKRTYGLRGKILYYIHQNLDAYLSACQLGITLASLGLGWVGEPAMAHLLEPLFKIFGLKSQELTAFISFFIAFSVLSFLHIVIGELVPKSIAIRQSEKISAWTAIPLYCFYWLMYPAIWILNNCANFILKITKLDTVSKKEIDYTPDEIKLILTGSHVHGQLTKQEIDILRHSLEFADLKVIDVMRPIDEMISLSSRQTINQALTIIQENRYSRYPIYDEATGEIIGIIHVKDLLVPLSEQKGRQNLKTILRPVLKVGRRTSAVDLLNQLQEGMPHFALVYSGRDTPIGFVTLDNIFQVLVGRVRDEFHKLGESWTIGPDNEFLISGNSSLYVLERALHIELEIDQETEEKVDTIFGLILAKLGRLPHQGEKIDFKQFSIVATNVKGHKILQVAVYPKN